MLPTRGSTQGANEEGEGEEGAQPATAGGDVSDAAAAASGDDE